MELRELLVALRDATEPTRDMDIEVGKYFGYVENTNRRWTSPNGATLVKLPMFTSVIDDAMSLTERYLGPGESAGCGWEPGRASAKIGSRKAFEASSPALALCIAAILAKAEADHNGRQDENA